MKRRKIEEGMVFAVPLRSSANALVVVTRHGRSAVTVGYFFGPPLDVLPEAAPDLRPEDALFVARFGDIPLVNEEWPLLGSLPGWSRSEWPSTAFYRGGIRSRGYVVVYDDRDPNKVIGERLSEPGEENLPSDDLHGYVIVRNRLSNLLL
ncbi:Imm26 family immunity protein [Micromonospora sp. URMC 103]|uniref:Imm26 family immunity protein n=1 Tax=Micromonospora sp. URMC 103 TaxID=3423406 RepID=UPI003F1DAEEC